MSLQMPIPESGSCRTFGLLRTSSVLRSVFHLDAQPGAVHVGRRAGRAVALEHPYDVSMAFEAGARYRRVPMTLRPVDIGAPGDQQLKHGDVVLFNGDHQRCDARLVGSVFENGALF